MLWGWNFKQIDVERGRQLVEAAAAVGFPTAMGYCFRKGWGGQAKDHDKAFEVFSAAAEQGYTRAVVLLGDCYQNGQGVEKNLSEAVKLYTQAVEKGNRLAMYNLGWCHEYGKGGLSVDLNLSEARRLYRMAADKGDASAVKALARLDRNNAP